MKINRVMVVIFACLIGISSSYANTLRWGSTTFTIKDFGGGGGTDLPFSKTDGTVGAFAQLIWAGANGVADAFTASGTGVTSDDVVFDVSYSVGANLLGTIWTNKFDYATSGAGSAQNGQVFYARVFNAANPAYASDTNAAIPGGATYYYQSGTTTFAYDAIGANQDFDISGGANQQTTIPVAVPEPGTMALLGIGMATVAIRRRKEK